jgi:serine/threonine-protein kinase
MIRVVLGALADQPTDAVLRPIRSDLAPVSSVSRDVAQRAGDGVADRLRALGQIPVGGAVLTPGGGLAASFVIHAVVMSEDEPQSRASVEKALRNGLARATDWGLASLALPVLGLGAGSMEPEEAARGFVALLLEHVEAGRPPLDLTVVAGSEYERALVEGLVG